MKPYRNIQYIGSQCRDGRRLLRSASNRIYRLPRGRAGCVSNSVLHARSIKQLEAVDDDGRQREARTIRADTDVSIYALPVARLAEPGPDVDGEPAICTDGAGKCDRCDRSLAESGSSKTTLDGDVICRDCVERATRDAEQESREIDQSDLDSFATDGGHEHYLYLGKKWGRHAEANIERWGNQPPGMLLLAMAEELGELAFAILGNTNPGDGAPPVGDYDDAPHRGQELIGEVQRLGFEIREYLETALEDKNGDPLPDDERPRLTGTVKRPAPILDELHDLMPLGFQFKWAVKEYGEEIATDGGRPPDPECIDGVLGRTKIGPEARPPWREP